VNRVLVTLELQPSDADFDAVKRRLALNDDEVDADYGLVSISPRRNLYVVLVDPEAAARFADSSLVKRVSADVQIEPAR
jgi:hypothetical protein